MTTEKEPLDLDAIKTLVAEQRDLVEAGDYDMSDWSHRATDALDALMAEVRRLREEAAERNQAVEWQYGVRRKGSVLVGFEFTREGAIELCAKMDDGREPVRRSRQGEWETFE